MARVIHLQGVNLLLKKGQLNGTKCDGYENGVSAVGRCARLIVIPKERLMIQITKYFWSLKQTNKAYSFVSD